MQLLDVWLLTQGGIHCIYAFMLVDCCFCLFSMRLSTGGPQQVLLFFDNNKTTVTTAAACFFNSCSLFTIVHMLSHAFTCFQTKAALAHFSWQAFFQDPHYLSLCHAMMDQATISSYSTGQLFQLILVIIQELCSRLGIEIDSEATFTFQFPAESFQQLVDASHTEAASSPELPEP